ncbi:MAG: hypothetical protein COA62_06985 [Rhodobiaceae bacterium]|nr:MAG: hypothetical protein COA62_06985 [Rhodobiaceae bacterium]
MVEYSNKTDEALFAAIGRLTVSWAHLELGLDAMIDTIFYDLENPPKEKELPIALRRKLKYLRKAVKLIPMRPGDAEEYAALIDNIAKESDIRHDIIHGAIVEHTEGTGTARAIRIIRERGKFSQKEIHLTIQSVMEAVVRVNKLAPIPLNFAALVQKAIHEQETTQARHSEE